MVISILNYNVEAINKYKQLTVELMRISHKSLQIMVSMFEVKVPFKLKCSFANCIGVAAREDRIYS